MLQLRQPGVYLQELSSGAHTISGAPTSIALFVGPTLSGIDGRPIRILNFGEFTREFGGLSATSNMSYSVLHFFANGGGEAFAIRVRADGAKQASLRLKPSGAAGEALTFNALSSGISGNNVFIEIDPFDINAQPFSAGADKQRFNLVTINNASGRAERFGNLTTSGADSRFAANIVNDTGSGSQFVSITVGPAVGPAPGTPPAAPKPTGTVLSIGALPVVPAAFLLPVRVTLKITPLDATGAPAASIALDVNVFLKDDLVPRTNQEMAARLVRALNSAIRADTVTKTALQGLEVDGALYEGATLLRLRLGATPVDGLSARLNDATVELVTKAGDANNDSLFALYSLVVKSTNSSRYQMGQIYPATEQFGAPTLGINGQPHGQPSDVDFLKAVQALEIPDAFFNTLCLPDLARGSPSDPATPLHDNAMMVYSEAARICGLKHALLLIDPPPNVTEVNSAENWKSLGFTFQSSFSAAFFPNIKVDDPLISGASRAHPPSGAIAGVIARTDANVGVWQTPAGTDAFLSGVYGPSIVLSDADHGVLNPLGLNVIRQFPIFNTVNFGSRTLDGSNALGSEWKYIPVRRTASYILRSLGDGLKWAVHQPNGDALWAQLRMSVNSFMQTLFRQGAFKGTSAKDAYFVKCDSETTSANDMDQGIVNILVGFAPLKPAEFVVVSLRQIVQANQ